MAETPATEPDPVGGGAAGAFAGRQYGGGSVLSRIKAKFQVDPSGVRTLRRELQGLTKDLNEASTALNKLGGGGTSGLTGVGGQGGSYLPPVAFSGQQQGGQRGGLLAGFGISRALAWGGGAAIVANVANNRIERNLAESIPINATDTLYQSMFGGTNSTYSKMRMMFGVYGGTRAEVAQAQAIGFRFGMGGPAFNQQVGLGVQQYGGTMTAPEVAAQYGGWMAPQVMWRAKAYGLPTAMQNGQPQNLGNLAMQYLRRYESMFLRGRKLTDVELRESMNPGAPVRISMRQVFGISDDQVDQILMAGAQSQQFAVKNRGAVLDFGNPAQLARAGLSKDSSLALAATSLSTTQTGREEQFYRDQAGDMRRRLAVEESMTKVMGDLEHRVRDLVGEFVKFGGIATKILDVVLPALIVKSLVGGGGGGLGAGGLIGTGIMSRGGLIGQAGPQIPGQQTLPGMGPTTVGGGGRLGGRLGGFGVGLGLMGAGAILNYVSGVAGGESTGPGAVLGLAGSTLTGAGMGAMFGSMIAPGPGTVIGATVGGLGGAAYSGITSTARRNTAEQAAARSKYADMPATELAKRFRAEWAQLDKDAGGGVLKFDNNVPRMSSGENSSVKIHAYADVWQTRRAATLDALMQALLDAPDVKLAGIDTYEDLTELERFFASGSLKDDEWNSRYKKVKKVFNAIKKSTGAQSIASTILGTSNLTDPYGLDPFPNEAQAYGGDPPRAALGGAGGYYGGDPRRPGGYGNVDGPGGGTPDADATTNSRLNKANPELARRIKAMIAANPRIWVGTAWRSSQVQADAYRRSPGRFAPPGQSLHEVGLAADLGPENQFDWIVQNAHRFGLATAVGWGEKWHVQIAGSVKSDPYTTYDPNWLINIGGNPLGINGGYQGNPIPGGGVGPGNTQGAIESALGFSGTAAQAAAAGATPAGQVEAMHSNIGATASGIGYSLRSSVGAGTSLITSSGLQAMVAALTGAGGLAGASATGGVTGTGTPGVSAVGSVAPGGVGGAGVQDPQTIYSYLRSQGVSPASAAGILANVYFESRFNPSAIGDNGTSGGLFQHHAGRWTALKNYAASTNRPWTDWKAQVEFALQEARSSSYHINLNATDPAAAAREWALDFEKMSGGSTSAAQRAARAGMYMYGGDPPAAAMRMHRLGGGGGGGGGGGMVIHFEPHMNFQTHPAMTPGDAERIADQVMQQLQYKVDAMAMRSV